MPVSAACRTEPDLGMPRIRSAQSCAADARQAAREFHAAVAQPDMALVIFFCSNNYDPEALADELRQLFPGVMVVGCSTAGEIGPCGYHSRSLSGASFPAASFNIVSAGLQDLQGFDPADGQAFAKALLQRLKAKAPNAAGENCFALLLIDGLSGREEPVTHALQSALGQLPLIGGSAGDDLEFVRTHVYFDGRFHENAAVLVLASTPLPFRLFQTQHYMATDQRFVVTEAEPAARIVKEINGLPAAEEYARMIGVPASDLTGAHFAAHPVVVSINGKNYVRSIQKAGPDGSLSFFCAIEEGLVLRLGTATDLIANLQEAFADIRAQIGVPQLVLGYDCILRRLEITQNGIELPVSEILKENNTIGLNTYGEQFCGIHVNQTFVGIAIGDGQGGGDERHAHAG